MQEPPPQVLIAISYYERLKASDALLRDIAKENATSVFAVDCVQKLLNLIATRINERPSMINTEIVNTLIGIASNRDGLLASLKEENRIF